MNKYEQESDLHLIQMHRTDSISIDEKKQLSIRKNPQSFSFLVRYEENPSNFCFKF